MSAPFFQTIMGRKFFESDVPALIRELSDLNRNLAQIASHLAARNGTPPSVPQPPTNAGTTR
jgi:hypothetical protein